MYETYVTIVGTAMTKPELRTTANTNTQVASFRVASHPRHFDQKTGRWTDGAGIRIKVNCWRRLADHVVSSIKSGDPVIVYGRQTTRDWKTNEGEPRTNFEVDAVAVGHDLSRGITDFTKIKVEPDGLVMEDQESDERVNGELTYSLSDPAMSDSGAVEQQLDPLPPSPEDDAIAILRAAGFDGETADEDETDEEEPTSAAAGSGGAGGRGRRRGRQPVPA